MKRCQFFATIFCLSLLILPVSCNSHFPDIADRSTITPITHSAFIDSSTNLKDTGKIATSAPTTDPTTPSGVAMKQSVTFLASDNLEGRGIGTNGLDNAAAYIAGNFQASGLERLPGMNDYFQQFELKSVDGYSPETFLKINDKPAKVDDDFRPISLSGEKAFDGAAVFVGYGITSKEFHYDDYAGIDVKGKVAVAWRFEPADKTGKSKFTKTKEWSSEAPLMNKCKNAIDHGAIALILINPPN